MKFKITITASLEYEVNPLHYGEELTNEEMLEIDKNCYLSEPELLFDYENTEIKVIGEIIE